MRNDVHALVRLADPAASLEPLGLIPDVPGARPADVLTSAALAGCQAALDVGVVSPDSQDSGEDACESMHRRKMGTCAAHFAALRAQGVQYRPLVLSAFGRLHPEAACTISALAAAAARRQICTLTRRRKRSSNARPSTAPCRRAVAMVRCCLPPLGPAAAAALLGVQ